MPSTDVMPAFARGHLGEADGSTSTPTNPPITTAGSLLNPPQGGQAGGHAALCMFCTYRRRVGGAGLNQAETEL